MGGVTGAKRTIPAHERGLPIDRAVSRARMREIVAEMCRPTQGRVSVEDVLGPRRSSRWPVVRIRWRAIAAVHAEYPAFSKAALGRLFGLDHTSIIYALRKVSDL